MMIGRIINAKIINTLNTLKLIERERSDGEINDLDDLVELANDGDLVELINWVK
jgi:hypothetical protein